MYQFKIHFVIVTDILIVSVPGTTYFWGCCTFGVGQIVFRVFEISLSSRLHLFDQNTVKLCQDYYKLK